MCDLKDLLRVLADLAEGEAAEVLNAINAAARQVIDYLFDHPDLRISLSEAKRLVDRNACQLTPSQFHKFVTKHPEFNAEHFCIHKNQVFLTQKGLLLWITQQTTASAGFLKSALVNKLIMGAPVLVSAPSAAAADPVLSTPRKAPKAASTPTSLVTPNKLTYTPIKHLKAATDAISSEPHMKHPLQELSEAKAQETGVYVIGWKENPEEVKIGITTNLKKRMKAFQTAHSRLLEVKYFFPVSNPRKVEKGAHKKGKTIGSHKRGEWFCLTPTRAAKLVKASIKECGGVKKATANKKRRAESFKFDPTKKKRRTYECRRSEN
jgi:hypothetical protein